MSISNNKRKTAYLLIYLISVIIGTIVIHEFAHFVAALALGVPINEIEVGFIGKNPGVTIPDRFINAPLGIFHYSGGFFTALVLIFVYFLIWYRKFRIHPSFFNWAYGAITILFVGLQLGQGYLEGKFHAAYMFYAGSVFSVTSIFTWGVCAFVVCFHFLFFPIPKTKK